MGSMGPALLVAVVDVRKAGSVDRGVDGVVAEPVGGGRFGAAEQGDAVWLEVAALRSAVWLGWHRQPDEGQGRGCGGSRSVRVRPRLPHCGWGF